jgi:hypothetical protein
MKNAVIVAAIGRTLRIAARRSALGVNAMGRSEEKIETTYIPNGPWYL